MLLFIAIPIADPYKYRDSNTSHVIVYRTGLSVEQNHMEIQIHLMLLFIPIMDYYLRASFHSNTSHVIVYQNQVQVMIQNVEFKYISCYCLSVPQKNRRRGSDIQIHLMLLFIITACLLQAVTKEFKYISCYCLSLQRDYDKLSYRNSNTSHVIVYLIPLPCSLLHIGIQIHLMLLFI